MAANGSDCQAMAASGWEMESGTHSDPFFSVGSREFS